MRGYDFGSKALPARPAPSRRTEQARAAMQRPLSAASVTALQPTVGNRAVGRLIQREEDEAAAGDKVRSVLRSGGTPLEAGFRSRAEAFLGVDFGHVRVHADGVAADSAAAVGSNAYTSGADIVFGAGQYDTGSAEGQHRLAHELTHVAQQSRGSVDGTTTSGGLKISDPSDRFEREADRMGAAFVSGHAGPSVAATVAAGTVARETAGPAAGTSTTVQRRKFTGQPQEIVTAKAEIKQSLNAKTAKECTARLAKRFPKGPLFSDNDVSAIKKLSVPHESQQWLKATGIGTTAEAFIYLRAKDFKGWLKLSPGRRLLAATLAWKHGMGKNDRNPPPPYTLGRAMAIQTGNLADQDRKQAEQERGKHIRDAFVNTLMPASALQKHAANDNAAVLRNAQAQQILTKILLILQTGLKVYDDNAKDHVDFKEGDVVRALAHGGRVNIRIPALTAGQSGYELTDWLGITQQIAAPKKGYLDKGTDRLGITQANARSHVPTDPVEGRGFGTHHMDIGENKSGPGSGTFKETGGKKASASNKMQSNVTLFGMDLAAGGIGNKDFNGDVIMPDGGHGHMFIGLTTPTGTKDGALQVGIETTGPGADSLVGYKHNWQSTEATANPESSFYGHKMHKVGEGKLGQNQRLVDLNELQSSAKDWLTSLDELEAGWTTYLALVADKRKAYEGLVGRRR